MTISQLDLVLLGGRGMTARLGSLEGALRSTGARYSTVGTEQPNLTRPNLLVNSSFEFYNRNETAPQDWTVAGATLNTLAADADGTATMILSPGDSISQLAAAGNMVVAGAFVISLVARASETGARLALGATHIPGVTYGAIKRFGAAGDVTEGNEVPADGSWYRFYVQGQLVGGAQLTVSVASAAGTLEIDAVKFEMEAGATSFIEPTSYQSSDWGSSTIIRDLKADNITAGTLTVGGSGSDNPRISVKDGTDQEIVTIGAPAGGVYGIEIKGEAGLKITGTGSAEVTGGGVIRAGSVGAQRVDMNALGIFSYNPAGELLGSISAVDGRWTVDADALIISGGVTFDSLAIAGAATVAQDFTVGTNVLFVDQSQSNVGINRAPDPQFNLDVAGSLRVGGYIVGRHALQLDEALLVVHFDGPPPFTPYADITGSATGHLGQKANYIGTPCYYPGKFNKAALVHDLAVNRVWNPSAETNTVNLTSLNVTVAQTNTQQVKGSYSFLLTGTASSPRTVDWSTDASAINTTYTQAMKVKGTAGQSVTLTLWDGLAEKGSPQTLVLDGTWQTIVQTATTGAAATMARPRLKLSANGQVVYVDCVQQTLGSTAPVYVDGSLPGGNIAWTGAAHASSSTRADHCTYYPWVNNIKPTAGTLSIWTGRVETAPLGSDVEMFVNVGGTAGNSIWLYRIPASNVAVFKVINASATAYAVTSAAIDWSVPHHLVGVWNTNDVRLYVDGVSVGTPITSATMPTTLTGTWLVIGRQSDVAQRYMNAWVDELVITGSPMTTAQVRALFESNAPAFVETSTWAWQTPNNLAWADSEGLWAVNNTGAAAFGVSGVDGKSWGNLGGTLLDKGDVLVGNSTQYMLWDASAAKLRIYGELVVGGGANFLWLNDANDGGLSIGGTVKGSAPFRVSAAGVATFNNANINLNGGGSLVAGLTTVNANGIAIGSWPGYYSASATVGFTYGGMYESQSLVAGSGVSTVTIDGNPRGSGYSVNNTVKLRGRDRIEWGSGYSELEVDGSGTTIYGNLYVGDQTANYLHWDGNYTRYQGNFVVDGDLYVAYPGIGWLSGVINQPVLTTSGPTFSKVITNGLNGFYNLVGGSLPVTLSGYQPGVSAIAGILGFNYGAVSGSASGVLNTSYPGAYIRAAGDGSLTFNSITAGNVVTTPFQMGANNVAVGSTTGVSNRLRTVGIDSSSSNNAFLAQNSGPVNLFYLRNDGYSWVNQNWAVGSDAALKDKIRDTDRGLADLLKAKPRKYERKNSGKTEHGFIAQELIEVFPELVSTEVLNEDAPEGTVPLLAVDYTSLIPVLVRAVQELSAQVEALKSKTK